MQRTKKLPQDTNPQMPQYLPIQPQPQQHPALSQSPNLIPQYGQFPSTYPYNTLNPQIFGNQQFNPSPSQPGTINPAAGLYAPIPFVGQHAQPGLQPINSNTTTLNAPSPHQNFAVEIVAKPLIREDVYIDDTRDIKRPKRISPLIPPHNSSCSSTDSSESPTSGTKARKETNVIRTRSPYCLTTIGMA